MRKLFAVLVCLLIPIAAMAQQRTGNITGTVTDNEGNALPGVTITLTGPTTAPVTQVTNPEGRFRFLSLFPGKDYQLKLELQGFKTKVETGVIVNVNTTADFKLVMEVGGLEEQVTVVAQTPVIQAKKTQVTHNISYDQLQELPTARDPWVVLQLTPAVTIDRENIGGVESGQQSSFSARGTTTQEWTVDGMQITDRNSGGSPGYFDFDAFEEMQVSTGMLDVEHRDPSIVINLVTRRGGNRTSLGGRFYYTDKNFQRELSAARIAEVGVGGYNRAVDIKDFGFNAGGPVVKDKVWWWGSYGVQQIQTINIRNVRDDTYLVNYNAKVNAQIIPENRLELLFQAGKKEKFGRDSSASFPEGYLQSSKFHFGNPTYKIQDEHMFGDDLFLSVRIGKSNAGFGMWPMNDPSITEASFYDYEKDLWTNNTWFYSDRPHPYQVLQAQYFNDDLLGTGTSHEIKIGAEFNNNNRYYWGGNPGNFYVYKNYHVPTVDWDGNGTQDIVRTMGVDLRRLYVSNNDVNWHDGTDRLAFYFNDTVSFGRFNLNLGLRADWAKSWIDPLTTRGLYTQPGDYKDTKSYADIALQVMTAETIAKINQYLPEKHRDYIEPKKLFWFFSPRLGLNYDLFGTGKTIVKLGYSLYPGGGLGTGYWTPYGVYPSMNFWWADLNGDNKANWDELYWANYANSKRPVYRVFDDAGNFVGNYAREYGLHWSGFVWDNPQGLNPPTSYIDLDNWKTNLTHEVLVSLDQEIMKDFGASLSFSWKRMGRFSWSPAYYPEEYFPGLNNHLRSQDDYMIGGYVPDTLVDPKTGKVYDPKESKGRPWYVLKNIPETATTAYSKTVMMDPSRYNIYWGFDVVLTKRLSNKWMFNGSASYQMQRQYYGQKGVLDLTNLWAIDGTIYGNSLGGGSGKISQNMFSRWMVKLSGLYQLPFDINLSGTLSAHEGGIVYESFGVQDLNLPNPRSNSNTMPTVTYDNRNRLSDVLIINFKLEKMIRLGDTGRMYFAADLFNALNNDVILRQYDISYGTFRFNDGSFIVPSANSGKPNEMVNPFLLRFGMRFQI